MPPADRARILEEVCAALTMQDARRAGELIHAEYRFEPTAVTKRKYSVHQMLDVFVRDGFTDRYSGARLLFPGVLHVLSMELPGAFPRHRNWKMSETHPAYWELMPTMDHVFPIARGGTNDLANCATTSMARNAAKANTTLDELGWTLHEPRASWDGLRGWFDAYVAQRPELVANPLVKRWAWASRHRRERGLR